MTWKIFSLISLALVLAFASFSFAQDDSAADDSSDDGFTATFEFSSPQSIEPDTTYEFTFTVTNTSTSNSFWIYLVEVFMPSTGYAVDENSISTPDALHTDRGNWESYRMDSWGDPQGILWEFFGLQRACFGDVGEAMGDIGKGESMEFAFLATTDITASSYFDWRLQAYSADCVISELFGTAFTCGQPDCTDDDSAADDSAFDGEIPEDDDNATGDGGGGNACGC